MAKHVKYLGNLKWDFSQLHTMPIDPAFTTLVERYLQHVLASDEPQRGWKLPETTLIFPWIIRMFPNIKYIHWIRDPRDSWCSARLHGHVYEATGSVRHYAQHWQKLVNGLLMLAKRNSNIVLVRYEDLAKDPHTVCSTLMMRVGLEFESRQICVEGYSSVTNLGETVNHHNLKKPISPKSVGRRRDELSEKELRAFSVCAELMSKCGYDPV
jgi:hypothetical protein